MNNELVTVMQNIDAEKFITTRRKPLHMNNEQATVMQNTDAEKFITTRRKPLPMNNELVTVMNNTDAEKFITTRRKNLPMNNELVTVMHITDAEKFITTRRKPLQQPTDSKNNRQFTTMQTRHTHQRTDAEKHITVRARPQMKNTDATRFITMQRPKVEVKSEQEQKIDLYNATIMRQLQNEVSKGTLQDKYHIGTRIGTGASGQVYMGQSIKGENTAIKFVPFAMTAGGMYNPFTVTELKFLKQCRHSNIVEYKDSYIVNNSLCLVMEMIGHSLAVISQLTSIKPTIIAAIAKSILQVLEFLHKKDIIHRDVKMSNILVGNDGKVKLADLGLCTKVGQEIWGNRMLQGVGTKGYKAPEVTSEYTGKYDCAVDIWSLGVTIMNLYNKWKQEPECESIDTDLEDFVKAALHFDPAKRPTASQLLKYKFISNAAQAKDIAHLIKDADVIIQENKQEKAAP